MSFTICADILEVMAGVCTLQLLGLLCFVICVEPEQHSLSSAWKSFIKPISLSIIIGTASVLGLNLVVVHFLREFGTLVGPGLWSAVTTFFLSTAELAYLYYSWYRSESIIKTIFPAIGPILKVCLHLSPVLLYSPTVPIFLRYQKIMNEATTVLTITVLTAINGLIVISFDSIMIFSFIQFLKKTRLRRQTIVQRSPNSQISNKADMHDAQFKIISIYGIMATSLCLLILSCFGAASVFKVDSLPHLIMTTVLCSLFQIVFLILFGMKIALHYHNIKRIKEGELHLERALGKEQLKSIRKSVLGSVHAVGSCFTDELSNGKASMRSMSNNSLNRTAAALARPQSLLSLSSAKADSTLVEGKTETQQIMNQTISVAAVSPNTRNLRTKERPQTIAY
ncbi:hypothetical protein BCR33DRAFT_38949 [Rhizoclosmatium globosum]|uniref:Uncharacterized protein n=1 Tax=Rhizoclosmatium globosum TaxID=329046 RepID=A0A1Y2CNL8_9FUNG|nr:hypothetical protein BCR33DRAFT_38949 [Rhizoclosmatium globosum]|eukprot:ORY48577.1 hypothetical protein BCR33DRAFT_38949 [Rhizoclosmatium globosum]